MTAREFDVERFVAEQYARGLELGAPFHHTRITASTNDDALAAARHGIAHGATFVADAQSAGRGRRGRSWFAAPGESLLCSLVLRSSLPSERVSLLALVAGLAVRNALASFAPSARVSVKWPNDVWLDQRKVAGVLCESQVQAGAVAATVVGFGVNVACHDFPEELRHSATSLTLAQVDVSREDLLLAILDELATWCARLSADGLEAVVSELSLHDALLGRRVRVEGVEGVAAGIGHSGGLLLRLSQDEIISLSAGSVEVVS